MNTPSGLFILYNNTMTACLSVCAAISEITTPFPSHTHSVSAVMFQDEDDDNDNDAPSSTTTGSSIPVLSANFPTLRYEASL
jgi:hypothetical protein